MSKEDATKEYAKMKRAHKSGRAVLCNEWLNDKQCFIDWYELNCKPGTFMDKDLISPANAIYSPRTCLFVLTPLSSYFDYSKLSRKDLWLGIRYNDAGKYIVRANAMQDTKTRTFDTLSEAKRWLLDQKNNAINLAILDRTYTEYGDLINQHLGEL